MRNGFGFWATVGVCFFGAVFCFQSTALSQCFEPEEECISTPYIWTNDLEFDGAAGAGISLSDKMRLTPQSISLPATADNGDMFIRHYWAETQSQWRDDIAVYLQGAWRRVLTTDDWYEE
jgi:hypothetical protein